MADETLFEEDIEDIEDIDEEDDEQELYDEYSDNDIEELDEEDIDEEDDILEELDDILEDYNEEIEEKKEEVVDNRTTFNILTKYEKNFIIGFRTQQLINGSVALIDVNKLKEKTPYNIAKEELKQRRIPFKVKRTLPNGKIEIWDLDELIIYD
jgi:DNA-directed RNA polymerase I, II, and III subunit RPABC2